MSGPYDPEIRLRLLATGALQGLRSYESDVDACRWALEEIERLREALRRAGKERDA